MATISILVKMAIIFCISEFCNLENHKPLQTFAVNALYLRLLLWVSILVIL